jgi:hypothetical protein
MIQFYNDLHDPIMSCTNHEGEIEALDETRTDTQFFVAVCREGKDPFAYGNWEVTKLNVNPVQKELIQRAVSQLWRANVLAENVVRNIEKFNDPEIIKPGTRVQINVDPKRIAGDWTPEAIASRKMKGNGVVQSHHDSHGLCYKVAHDDDGTIGAYEPHELTAC